MAYIFRMEDLKIKIKRVKKIDLFDEIKSRQPSKRGRTLKNQLVITISELCYLGFPSHFQKYQLETLALPNFEE